MYFQISENIVSRHANLRDVISFVDSILNDTTNEARLRADDLARSGELDLVQVESVMDIYCEHDAFDQIEMIECEDCQTLTKIETIQAALDDDRTFQCTSCNTSLTEKEFSDSESLTVYRFQVALAKRTDQGDEPTFDEQELKRPEIRDPNSSDGDSMQLTDDEARQITALFNECFKSSQEVVNFAAASAAVSIQGKINTADAETAVQTLITKSHAQELLGEVLVDLAKKFPRKEDRALGFAAITQAKYKAANDEFRKKMQLQVENSRYAHLDQSRDHFLERATSLNAFVDLKTLGRWTGEAEQRICRVRCDGDDFGTGFLISNQLVLTCYHVIEACFPGKKRKYISVAFDDDNIETTIKVDPEWDIPFAKYSDRDNLNSTLDPEPENLDFAILKLANSAGDRGCFELDDSVPLPEIGEPTLMAGHPGPGRPLQPLRFSMAAPGFAGTTKNEARLIYRHSSEKGSSGSPVVDRKCRLFGLHHNRGKEGDTFYHDNRGIPIVKIIEFIKDSQWSGVEELAKLL